HRMSSLYSKNSSSGVKRSSFDAQRRDSGGEGGSDSEFCEQAFLSAVGRDGSKGRLRTFDEFAALVQQTGRNPSQRALRQYWDRHNSRRTGVDLQSFLEVCRQEPVTTRDELLDAFHAVDLNSDGYLSLDEFVQMLSSGGEPITKLEARELLQQYDKNGDGKLDYEEFIDFVLGDIKRSRKSIEDSRRLDSKRDRDWDRDRDRDSDRDSRDESPKPVPRGRGKKASTSAGGSSAAATASSSEVQIGSGRTPRAQAVKPPADLKKWTQRRVTGFYLLDSENNSQRQVLSSHYTLNLSSSTNVYITMQSMPQDKLQTMQSECDIGFALFRDGKPVAVCESPAGNKSAIGLKADLGPGDYELLPYCIGDKLHMEATSSKAKSATRNKKITAAGKAALEDIFKLCDTNQDGVLDRAELQVYNYITSNEELTDELWNALRNMVKLSNDALDFEGFIDLSVQELEEDNWSEENFWINLKSFGVNQDLLMTGAFAYELEVNCSECRNFELIAGNPMRFPVSVLSKGLANYTKEKGSSAQLGDCTLHWLETPLRVYIAGEKDNSSQAMPTRLLLDARASHGVADVGETKQIFVKRSCGLLLQLVPDVPGFTFSATVRPD
ncbi:hypothetical protein BOX15_Mlig016656g1, partial [Macrostomum lignano]